MWATLQSLKAFRARQAQLALQARRSELAVARRAHEAAAQALQAHRRLAEDHERTLYAELLRRLVRLRDLEDVQHAVAQARRTEAQLAARAQQAAEDERAHERQAAEALQAHRGAERAQEKFDRLAREHHAEAALAAERAEDLELEEAAAQRREREDWDPPQDGDAL